MEVADEYLRVALVALSKRGKSRGRPKCKHSQQLRLDFIGGWDIIQMTDLNRIDLLMIGQQDVYSEYLHALSWAEH